MKNTKRFLAFAVIAAFIVGACAAPTLLINAGTSLVRNANSSSQASTTLTQAATPTAVLPQVSNVSDTVNQPQTQTQSGPLLAAYQGTLEQIYAQVAPSVVNIDISQSASSLNIPGLPAGHPPVNSGNGNNSLVPTALGSGFVWDNQGDIVTNNHVVSGADAINVTFSDGSSYPATLVGADLNSDLAVVKVKAPASELHPVQLADSNQVKVGQLAIAIGNPYGLSGTMTSGIVSALSRSLPVGLDNQNAQSQSGPTYTIPDIIQTDASINPGNSGGVLVNDHGQVIGVTSAIESNSNANAGIGFVIPSAIVQKVVPSLIQTGKYQHPWIGIEGTTITSDLATADNLPSGQQGVLVINVTPNSPAAKAGLQGGTQTQSLNGSQVSLGGDVITAVDGQPVKNFEDLTSYLFINTKVGQTINLTVLRNGQQMKVQVTLGTVPTQ
ncbi:MAG: trypsin-like peptidase domain-containing protein [Anaerolineales bacterium]|jgi:S1-C subfamily serine protease